MHKRVNCRMYMLRNLKGFNFMASCSEELKIIHKGYVRPWIYGLGSFINMWPLFSNLLMVFNGNFTSKPIQGDSKRTWLQIKNSGKKCLNINHEMLVCTSIDIFYCLQKDISFEPLRRYHCFCKGSMIYGPNKLKSSTYKSCSEVKNSYIFKMIIKSFLLN